jgi:hypothetical protein
VRALGVDETSFLRATRTHPTLYATGLVDLDERILIDLVAGNSAADLRRWLDGQPPGSVHEGDIAALLGQDRERRGHVAADRIAGDREA